MVALLHHTTPLLIIFLFQHTPQVFYLLHGTVFGAQLFCPNSHYIITHSAPWCIAISLRLKFTWQDE